MTENASNRQPEPTPKPAPTVKVVVWDLDNTVWDGVLLEDGDVSLRPGVAEALRVLDERGVLHSIASRNEPEAAMAKLAEFGLDHYFLYPQIHWNSKSDSIAAIAKAINIGIDTLAFIDDQPFEREEVAFSHPQVRCIDAAEIEGLVARPEMMPRFVTEDSRRRREMYRAEAKRKQIEADHSDSPTAFLASLDMRFAITPARTEDLQRAEELTVRTNQLNATGYTYSYEELEAFMRSPDHELLVASLDDKYGTYGKIGLVLIEREPKVWTVKLLLMSCRVMSRGVGTVLLNAVIRRAQEAQVRLLAEFVETKRNRMMNVTYRFAGFKALEQRGEVTVLENDFSVVQDFPDYMAVDVGF